MVKVMTLSLLYNEPRYHVKYQLEITKRFPIKLLEYLKRVEVFQKSPKTNALNFHVIYYVDSTKNYA